MLVIMVMIGSAVGGVDVDVDIDVGGLRGGRLEH